MSRPPRRISTAILSIVLAASCGMAAQAGKARILSTGEQDVWCGFPTPAQANAALKGDRFDGGTGVEIDYHGGTIDRIVMAVQSEDAFTEDHYSFAGTRVTRIVRRGHYINDPYFTVTLEPDAGGKMRLTPASRAEMRRQDKAQHETYWTKWPVYADLSKFPFARLIQRQPAIAVLHACQRLHWSGENFVPVGPPRQAGQASTSR